MTLVVNVGNTATEIGILAGTDLVRRWTVSTDSARTADEYSIQLAGLLNDSAGVIERAVVGSVVPAVTQPLVEALRRLATGVLVVGPGVKTGMPMQVDNPREVGADRVAMAVAAKAQHDRAVVVVGFGTAITVDVVDATGAFVGGAIAPGIDIGLEALIHETAALRRVLLEVPREVIGGNTVEAIQAGMVFGFCGLVNGLVDRVVSEVGGDPVLVATGRRAELLVPLLNHDYLIEPNLVLLGLGLLAARN